MKRIILSLLSIFIGTTAIAHTINWYVDGNILHTTTCESGDDITPPTPPEKYGYTFQEWLSYTPIEYIESTGTQWIDTEIKFDTNNYRADITMMPTSFSSNKNHGIFGSLVTPDNTGRGWAVTHYYNTNKDKLRASVGDIIFGSSNAKLSDSLGKKQNISMFYNNDSRTISLKDNETNIETTQNITGNVSYGYNMYLFSIYYKETSASTTSYIGRLYDFKLYINNVIIRNLIPVLDPYNIPCMYDLVEQKYYYNAGTGDFIAGPIISETNE